jgi:hypothetical protein
MGNFQEKILTILSSKPYGVKFFKFNTGNIKLSSVNNKLPVPLAAPLLLDILIVRIALCT